MNKIYKILTISAILTLVSACSNSGAKLDKKNVTSAENAVTNNVTNQVRSVNSNAAAISNSTTQAAKQLR